MGDHVKALVFARAAPARKTEKLLFGLVKAIAEARGETRGARAARYWRITSRWAEVRQRLDGAWALMLDPAGHRRARLRLPRDIWRHLKRWKAKADALDARIWPALKDIARRDRDPTLAELLLAVLDATGVSYSVERVAPGWFPEE